MSDERSDLQRKLVEAERALKEAHDANSRKEELLRQQVGGGSECRVSDREREWVREWVSDGEQCILPDGREGAAGQVSGCRV